MRKASKRVLGANFKRMSKILRETLDSARKCCEGLYVARLTSRRRFRAANLEFFRKAMRLINLDAFANPAIEVLVVFCGGPGVLAASNT